MEWQSIGRYLIGAGILLALVGVILVAFGRLPFLGQLPGDLTIRRGRTSFYFPVVTCVLISLLANLVLWFFRRR